jgi:biopolymer transport protein ExbB/TolQ
MEITSTHLTVIIAITSAVIWLIRLENKAANAANLALDSKTHFAKHCENNDIHHDTRAYSEFKSNIDLKFSQANQQMSSLRTEIASLKSDTRDDMREIKDDMKNIDAKLNKILGN